MKKGELWPPEVTPKHYDQVKLVCDKFISDIKSWKADPSAKLKLPFISDFKGSDKPETLKSDYCSQI